MTLIVVSNTRDVEVDVMGAYGILLLIGEWAYLSATMVNKSFDLSGNVRLALPLIYLDDCIALRQVNWTCID